MKNINQDHYSDYINANDSMNLEDLFDRVSDLPDIECIIMFENKNLIDCPNEINSPSQPTIQTDDSCKDYVDMDRFGNRSFYSGIEYNKLVESFKEKTGADLQEKVIIKNPKESVDLIMAKWFDGKEISIQDKAEYYHSKKVLYKNWANLVYKFKVTEA